MYIPLVIWILIQASAFVHAFNFPFESIQLVDADVKNNSAIAFGATSTRSSQPTTTTAAAGECKVYPGDAKWPSESAWHWFNDTLDGALIKGAPPARVCYPGYYDADKCAAVKANYFNSRFRSDDPVSIVSEWLDGDSCPPAPFSTSNVTASNVTVLCNLAAYPAYVVNATTVKRKKYRNSPQSLHTTTILQFSRKLLENWKKRFRVLCSPYQMLI
jgi:hypothetical protein